MLIRSLQYLLIMITIVMGSALLIDLTDQGQGEPQVSLTLKQLNQIISLDNHCETGETCPIISYQALSPSSIYLSEQVKQQLQQSGYVMVSSDENEQVIFSQSQGKLYRINLAQDNSETIDQYHIETIIFYVLVFLSFAVITLPMFVSLTGLNRLATQFSKTGKPVKLPVSKYSFVSPLVTSFNHMTHSLSDLMLMQKELSATVCHELRTPLSKLEFIAALVEDTPPQELKQQLQSLCQQMNTAIDEYLTYSATSDLTPAINITKASVEPMLQGLKADFQALLSQQLIIVCHTQTASFDFVSVNRAVNNLIGNAAKFAATKIMVSFYQEQAINHLIVEDDGPGIRTQNDLLEPFVRGDINKPGYGLGLAIVNRVMSWHQGEVIIGNSNRLNGAKITLRWPEKLLESRIDS